jgi:hypothetical protein
MGPAGPRRFIMKRKIIAIIGIAMLCLSLSGCLTLKPFTQEELDQLSAVPASSQVS